MEKIITPNMIKELFPKRKLDSNKSDYGTLSIIGGSLNYAGAPILSSLGAAALLCGTGIVRLCVPRSIVTSLYGQTLECTYLPMPESNGHISPETNILNKAIEQATAVVCGMGITNNIALLPLLLYLIDNVTVPLVLDADALNILSAHLYLLTTKRQCPIILTPHIKEMSRLIDLPVEYIKSNRVSVACEFAKKYNVICVLKDYITVITDGKTTYINTAGTPAMSKGGSGDVLSGAIGGLLAQGISPIDSCIAGAYLCGKAGEKARLIVGNDYSVLPTDTANNLSNALTEAINS
ncbi:MAG: NAD(P)H-hydrate dehydratase [Clostridia bacterium]